MSGNMKQAINAGSCCIFELIWHAAKYLFGVELAALRLSVELEHRHGLDAADLVHQGRVHGALGPLRRHDVVIQAQRVRPVQLAVRKSIEPRCLARSERGLDLVHLLP